MSYNLWTALRRIFILVVVFLSYTTTALPSVVTFNRAQLPFQHNRKAIFAPLPTTANDSLGLQPVRPAFQPGKTYVYNVTLNTTSETYSFTFEKDQNQTDYNFGDIDASGLAANVSAVLTVQTQADSPENNTLIFLAYIDVPDCAVTQGKPIGQGGYDVVRDTAGTGESCLPNPGVNNQTTIWVTQDLSSGEFKNVYYNASTAQEPEDPIGYQKLVVSALRTLQSYYNGSEIYEHTSTDRYGNPRTVRYAYIGQLGDAQCWQADSRSVNEDELAADSKKICWSPMGGVSKMTGGDATALGTIRDQSEVIEKAVASSGSYAVLSENGTLEVVSQGEHTTIQPGLGGPWVDLQQGVPSDPWGSIFFALNADGQMYRQVWHGSDIEEELYGNITFSVLGGGPPVELPGRYRSQWALDTVGAIWGTYEASPASSGPPVWTNYTNPEDLVIGNRAVQFWPFHNSDIQVAAQIYGFYLSDDLTAYILYEANGNTVPSVSDFPSLNVVEERLSFLELAPVGPLSSNPVVVAIGEEDQKFYYSTWNPANPGLINPADGFSDWQVLNLSGPAMKIEPWRLQQGPTWDEGVFVVMQDSTVLSIQRDLASVTGWKAPQQVQAPQTNEGILLGALDVSFDKWTAVQPPEPGRAFVGTFAGVNVSTIAYQGLGTWVVEESWKPFLNLIPFVHPDDPPEHGFPAMTASTQANAFLGSTPAKLIPDDETRMSELGGNWSAFSILPFNSPQWMQQMPENMSESDITRMVQTLYSAIDDPSFLVDFRRNISNGGQPAIETLCRLILSGQVAFEYVEQSSAILSTVVMDQTTESVEAVFIKVIDPQPPESVPDGIKISAIQQSIAMSCSPGLYVEDLTAIANGSVTGDTDDLEAAGSSALGVFATKQPCAFTEPHLILESHHIVQILHNKTVDAERNETILKGVYGLANTRHPNVIDKVIPFLNHSEPALRVAAIRAIANVPTDRATGYLVHHIQNNDESVARYAGLQALKYHQHERPISATKSLLCGLFEPRVRRSASDLDGLQSFFRERVSNRAADQRISRIGLTRLGLVERALVKGPDLGTPLFKPVRWSKSFSGSNVQAAVGFLVHSDFGTDGADFQAQAYAMGSLFRTNFDIAAASVTAAWTSEGYMSFTMWTAVFLIDFKTMRQVPYYLLNVQFARQTAFQLKQGDPCTLTLPDNPAITIRETRSFIQAKYYYGIPVVANVNLQVQLLGWFEVGYGVQLVTRNLSSPLPGQIVGYIRPAAGLGGQISANVQILVASGGLQGNLDFAAIAIPAGGGMIVNSLSPFSVGFGDLIQLQGRFLSGRVTLYVQIWNCCCWYCWFSCCFRCGGGCNYGREYTIFQWNGIDPSPFQIDNRRNLCTSLMSSSNLPPTNYNRQQARLLQPQFRSFSATPPDGDVTVGEDPEDSEFWCLCSGYFDPAANFKWMSASGFSDYGYFSTSTNFLLPEAGLVKDMDYDCSRYPGNCQNTACWQDWYPNSPGTLYFNYDDNLANQRSYSMSAISKISAGTNLNKDECPMNKVIEGGCCARVQAVDSSGNKAHGGAFCKYLEAEFGVLTVRNPTGKFGINLKGTFGGASKTTCKNNDFRYIVGGGTWYPPSTQSKCNCKVPTYAFTGLPSFDYANMTLYLAASNHPRLSFAFGETMEVHYQPLIDPSIEVVRYSRLQNLTIGHRTLVVHGNITQGSDNYLQLLTGGGDMFQVYLNPALFDLNVTAHNLVAHMSAEFSHLVSHPENLSRQKQVESRSEVFFNVSDVKMMHNILGTPAVLRAKKPETPLVPTYPAEQPSLQPGIFEWFKQMTLSKKLRGHLMRLAKPEVSPREIILMVLLGLVSLVVLLQTSSRGQMTAAGPQAVPESSKLQSSK